MARAGHDVDAVAAQVKVHIGSRRLISISQPLQPPADTERSLSERPKCCVQLCRYLDRVQVGVALLTVSASRAVAHSLTSLLKLNLRLGKLARSRRTSRRPLSQCAPGQAAGAQRDGVAGARQGAGLAAVGAGAVGINGLPRKPTGWAARRSVMY